MSRAWWTTVVLVAGGLAVSSSAPAFGQGVVVVGCGAVLTTDTTLTADVLDCVGDGLVVGADNVTLNLNGHLVDGDAVEDPTDVGIRVAGHRGVRVTNGTVQGFYRGVVFESSPSGVASSLTVRQSSRRGIVFLDGSDGAQVLDNVSADNGGSGITVVASDGASVVGNHSVRNPGGAGIRLVGATHATVTGNTVTDDQIGVQMEDSSANRVADNAISGAAEIAVVVDFSTGNLIDHNHISRSGDGVTLESADDNVITGNQILHLVGPDGIGIQIYGNRNLVARNTVIDSVRYGIEVDDFGDPGHSPAVDNVVRDNVVNGGGEGIAIGPEAGGVVLRTVVAHNVVTGATDDGIQLVGPSTGLATSTLTGNTAVHNGNLGIEAAPGTIDGGGNHAAGNGNHLQCLNIACR
ncbi:MAG: NosD domain-containing protein [Lapillicoccus sp.]